MRLSFNDFNLDVNEIKNEMLILVKTTAFEIWEPENLRILELTITKD